MTFHTYLINAPLDEHFDLVDEKFNVLIENVCPASLKLAQYDMYCDWEYLGGEVLIRRNSNGQEDSRWSVIVRRMA